MLVMGIDPSLNATGIVIIDFSEKSDKVFDIKYNGLISANAKMGDVGRLIYIKNEITKFIEDYNIDHVAMEGLSFGARGRAMLQLAGLNYILQILFEQMGIKYQIIPPTAMKKFVVGKGNAPKDQVMLKAFKKWKVDFNDNNICDAFCHAMYYENNLLR